MKALMSHARELAPNEVDRITDQALEIAHVPVLVSGEKIDSIAFRVPALKIRRFNFTVITV